MADQDQADVEAPDILARLGLATFPQLTLLTVGFPPWPEDDMLNDMLLVTLSQFISVLNSNEISTVVAFVSPGLTWIR